MPRSPRKKEPRVRRTAEDARAAILDAAEAMLSAHGAAGVRLQDVAEAAGMSHPTVLHHFGSRDGLLAAVADRALSTLRIGALSKLTDEPGLGAVERLLEAVAAQMADGGRARTLMQLTLAGAGGGVAGLGLGPLIDAVHAVRVRIWADEGRKKPSREDTQFTVLMTAMSLLSLSVLTEGEGARGLDVARFRAWLAKLVHRQLHDGLG